MRTSSPIVTSIVAGLIGTASIASGQSVSARVDSSRHTVIIDAGPFDVPAMDSAMLKEMQMEHSDMQHDEERRDFRFDWPVDGVARGYRIELRDASGARLSRDLLHHLIAINFDRRQFIYPMAERLFGIGRETPDVSLPGSLVVPLALGQRLGFYVAWHNDTGRDIHGVTVRIAIDWISRSAARSYTAVLPVYFDVDNEVGATNTFDVPPGRSSKAFEFASPVSGHLVVVTGHLHDYGRSVRLEDAETGKTLFSLAAERDAAGKIIRIPRKVFLLKPLRMREGHRYRIVAEYESPLPDTIYNGAMANILGVFAPDVHSKWPTIDPNDATFKKDIESLPIVVPQSDAGNTGQPRIERITYSQRQPH
jgi:hypothetical protein